MGRLIGVLPGRACRRTARKHTGIRQTENRMVSAKLRPVLPILVQGGDTSKMTRRRARYQKTQDFPRFAAGYANQSYIDGLLKHK